MVLLALLKMLYIDCFLLVSLKDSIIKYHLSKTDLQSLEGQACVIKYYRLKASYKVIGEFGPKKIGSEHKVFHLYCPIFICNIQYALS